MANFAFNPGKQRILDAVDLADLIGEQLSLRRAGKEFKAVCPFHDDTNPSLFINPHKGIYKCFACGAGGNALTWLEKYFNMTRGEAWKLLAERTGIELQIKTAWVRRPPRSTTGSASAANQPADSEFPDYVDLDPAEIVKAHQTALSFYRTILKHPTHGAEARSVYAARDIDEAMIERFELGAAPGGNKWDGLVQTLQARQIDLEAFLASGLVSKRRSSDGYYDRFRNRLIFPIHDLLGRPIAFGARIIDVDDEPKYLNSPEHPRFNKSATLYGLHLAQRAIQAENRAIVVEGYTDVIACHRAEVTNAVATLGTALTREHAMILQRFCPRVVLLFDGDQAGRKAADRAVEIFFQTNIDIQIALLPDGMDPADLLNEVDGRSRFDAIIDGAIEALDFLLTAFQKEIEGDSGISGRQRRIEEFLARLGALGYHRMSPVRRDLVIPRLAEMLGIPRETIHQSIPKPRQYGRDSTNNYDDGSGRLGSGVVGSQIEIMPRERSQLAAERGILGCLLNQPRLLVESESAGSSTSAMRDRLNQIDWSDALHRELYERLEVLVDGCAERQELVPTMMPDFEDAALDQLANDLYWEINRQTKDGNFSRIQEFLEQFCQTIGEFDAEAQLNLGGLEPVPGGDISASARMDMFTARIGHLRDIQAQGGRRRYALGAGGGPAVVSVPAIDDSAELEIENVTSPSEAGRIIQAPVDGTPENSTNQRMSGDS